MASVFIVCLFVCFFTVVRIGFEQTMYVAVENSSVEICAIILAPPTLGKQVVINLATTDDTAECEH